MALEYFIDRVPGAPGRVLVTPENGETAFYATLRRADNPSEDGTPLNAESFNLIVDWINRLTPAQIEALPVDGNAISASRLQTSRYIGNASFDGSANILLQQIGIYAYGHYITIPALAAGGQADVSVDLSGLPDNVKSWVSPYKPILFIGRQTSGPISFNWGAANPDIVNWTVSVTFKNITTAATYSGAYSFYVVVFGG